MTSDIVESSAVRSRALDYIRNKWGLLNDLPVPVIPVIWVTVYRSIETAMKVEKEGGAKGLLKNRLIGDRMLTPQLEIATVRINFLRKMIPLIREHQSSRDKLADANIVIDFLKWNPDVATISPLRRAIA